MDWLFGRKTVEQQLRENQRALNKTMRELDREKVRLESEEKKVIGEIKKMAKQGQMDAVKIMAKDLVRTRNYVKKFILMRANVQAVSLKIQTLKSTHAMASAMKGVTRTMQRMNRSMNMPQLQKIMMEFEKQTDIMDMKEEMMTDAIDDALGEEGDIEEGEAVVNQVLDELGIEMTDTLAGLPTDKGSLGEKGASVGDKRPAAAAAAEGGPTGPIGGDPSGGGSSAGGVDDDDLEARLNRLKRG